LFDVSPKGGYNKIFGDPVSHLSKDEFSLLAGTYFACELIRDIWESNRSLLKDQDKPLHPALERRWMVYYAVSELLRLAYTGKASELDDDVRRLAKPSWLDAPDSAPKACIQELYEIGTTALEQAYSSRAKAETFRHRNWFRNEHTLTDIKEALAPIPTFRGKNNPLPRLR
jgi:hypothetical protein